MPSYTAASAGDSDLPGPNPEIDGIYKLLGGVTANALAAESLKVAAVSETPIEDPWVNQVYVACAFAARLQSGGAIDVPC